MSGKCQVNCHFKEKSGRIEILTPALIYNGWIEETFLVNVISAMFVLEAEAGKFIFIR